MLNKCSFLHAFQYVLLLIGINKKAIGTKHSLNTLTYSQYVYLQREKKLPFELMYKASWSVDSFGADGFLEHFTLSLNSKTSSSFTSGGALQNWSSSLSSSVSSPRQHKKDLFRILVPKCIRCAMPYIISVNIQLTKGIDSYDVYTKFITFLLTSTCSRLCPLGIII